MSIPRKHRGESRYRQDQKRVCCEDFGRTAEAGPTATLALAGVNPGDAVLASNDGARVVGYGPVEALGDDPLDQQQLQRLLAVGRSIVSSRDLDAVLRRVLAAAQELTGARYAALGVLDADKQRLGHFVFAGIEEEQRERIGNLPTGHGILGELIRHPEPLRLSRISDHPHSYGFPAEHPQMQTFLGVPVMIRGEVYGNLYLTDKHGGPFDELDERLVIVLSEWAAVAIDNARSHAGEERRRRELERAVRGLDATVSLSRDLGSEPDLERVLELVVKRGRALVEARGCVVLLTSDQGLRVAAAAGDLPANIEGETLTAGDAVAGLEELGVDCGAVLLASLRSRGSDLGALLALHLPDEEPRFSGDDDLAFASFATSAATVIGGALAAEDERLRLTIAASERERQRWARELHDETLQDLGALRVMQQSALRSDREEVLRTALEGASNQVEEVIGGLQSLITELRPAALDQLGIGAAIEALADRVRRRSRVEVETSIALTAVGAEDPPRFDPELEATVYRLVQEALTNVVKHAGATRAHVSVKRGEGALLVTVEDDGRGIEPGRHGGGFGLVGMRERVELADGELRLGAGRTGGTRVWASLPDVSR